MKLCAWAVCALGLLLSVSTSTVAAQEEEDRRQEGLVQLERNFPNPFNPETFIPFRLSQELWEGGTQPVVSLRIYNVLAQLVAVPVLQGSGDELLARPLEWNGTGRYQAYWDGRVMQTDREAPSGVYVYQIEVNGRRMASKKMMIIK